MLLMVEKGIRDGICHAKHRHAKANNKYLKNYDKKTLNHHIHTEISRQSKIMLHGYCQLFYSY